MAGEKPSPDSIVMRAMRGDREAIAILKASGTRRSAGWAAKTEARLERRAAP
jgi:hypothetical protein